MKEALTSLIFGSLFGLGLGLSGMMSPVKVQGFLDMAGRWDPSLALVMGGAVAVTFLTYPLILKRPKPLLGGSFGLPTTTKLDTPLLVGAVLFGSGWAIAGLCPGPALANLATFNTGIFAFVASMITGFWLYRKVTEELIHLFSKSAAEEKARTQHFRHDQCVVD